MFPFQVTVDEKIRSWGEEDAANLRRMYPTFPFDTEEVIRCKAVVKAAQKHYVNKDGKTYLMSLTVSDIYGKSDDEILRVIEARVAKNKKSAGARALSNKYGKRAAERIILEKTGKSVTLQR